MKKRNTNKKILIVAIVSLFAVAGYFALRGINDNFDSNYLLLKNDENIEVTNDFNENEIGEINSEDVALGECAVGHYKCAGGTMSGTSCFRIDGKYGRGCNGQNIGGNCGVYLYPATYVCDQYASSNSSSSSGSSDGGSSTVPKVDPEAETKNFVNNFFKNFLSGFNKTLNTVKETATKLVEVITEVGKYYSTVGSGKCTISVSGGAAHVSKGDKVAFSVTASNNCKKLSYTCTNASCSGSVPGAVIATVTDACATVSITVTGDGGARGYASISASNTKTRWSETSDPNINVNSGSRIEANAAGNDVYGTDCRVVDGKKVCDHVYVRSSCGYGVQDYAAPYISSSSSSPTEACYGDGPTLSLSTKVRMATASTAEYPFKLSGVSNCSIPVNTTPGCIPSAQLVKNSGSSDAGACEGNVSVKQTEKSTCDGEPFYTISCDTTAVAKFDYGDDCVTGPNVNNIFAGQGFKFGITITTTRTCKGKFNKAKWKEAYLSTTGAIQTLEDLKGSAERINELKKIKEDLEQAVRTYNSFNVNPEYSESSDIKLTYNVDGDSHDISKDFEPPIVIDAGRGKYTERNVVNLGVSGLDNPYDWSWSTVEKPRFVKLVPKKTFISRITGKEDSNGLDGGNKIYTDPDTDPGEITLNITTKVFDGSSTIKNNMCKLEIGEKSISYRPIELTNPFINSAWKKGENWSNSIYDFTQTIDVNTWNKNALYTFELKQDTISAIKDSNKRNIGNSPYMGLCKIQDETMQDSITKNFLCKIIK